jgi:hypothetical protein
MLLTSASFPNLPSQAEEAAFHIAILRGDDRTLPKSQIFKSSNFPSAELLVQLHSHALVKTISRSTLTLARDTAVVLVCGMTPTVSSQRLQIQFMPLLFMRDQSGYSSTTVPRRTYVCFYALFILRVGSMITISWSLREARTTFKDEHEHTCPDSTGGSGSASRELCVPD